MSAPATRWEDVYATQTARITELERENVALREALEISDDYINQMLHGDVELTHGQLEAWRKVIYRLRTKEAKP